MGKQKARKSRLDKATSANAGTDFIGFGAFQAPGAASEQPSFVWTPVYTGSDATLSSLFPRIGQKRDAVTVCKGIQELQVFLQDEKIHKKTRAEALLHWAWLYHSKISLDPNGGVRAAALQAWDVAAQNLPKAVSGVTQQQPELLGIFFLCKLDPATEVRSVAASCTVYKQEDRLWQKGLVDYSHRMLLYGRASAMQDALFPKRKAGEDESDERKEQIRDAMEERFERLVGNCLDALNLWINGKDETALLEEHHAKAWWKYLQSSKHSLRRKTYELLRTVTSRTPFLLPSNLGSALSQAVSSEKEAINLPTLLETILALLAQQRKSSPDKADELRHVLVKPLSKVFKKACYGSRVELWGPVLLPLLAQYSMQQQRVLLKAAHDGIALVLSDADRWSLILAVAESASFVLLRPSGAEVIGDVPRNIVELWLDCLQNFLTTETKTSRADVSRMNLLGGLATDLVQFDNASSQQRDCAYNEVSDWFWDEGLQLEAGRPMMLAELLRELDKRDKTVDRLLPSFRSKFFEFLAGCQRSSGAIPSSSAFEFFQAALEYFGPVSVFKEVQAIEKFVMNDLLRWTVVHTSALSESGQMKMAVKEFRLLAISMSVMTTIRHSLWESFIREILAAKCELGTLVAGLRTLLQCSSTTDWIECESLDKFAVHLATQESILHSAVFDSEESSGDPSADDADGGRQQLDFFLVCLGVGSDSEVIIVSKKVISLWVSVVSDMESTSTSYPLLEALLQCLSAKRSVLSEEEARLILLGSWRSRDDTFDRFTSEIFQTERSLLENFVAASCHELRESLSSSNLKTDDVSVSIWSMKAWRLLRLGDSVQRALASRSIGLNEVEVWRSKPELLFLLSTALLRHIDGSNERVALIKSWTNNDLVDFLIEILLAMCEASADVLLAARTKARHDYCARFLVELGGRLLEKELVHNLILALVAALSAGFKKQQSLSEDDFRRQVSVISQLIDLLFEPIALINDIEPRAEDISTGDQLWYIADPNRTEGQEEVEVVKAHYDAEAGYYFTVRLERDGSTQERQTVVGRLRKKRWSGSRLHEKPLHSISESEWNNRSALCTLLLQEVLAPNHNLFSVSSFLAELLNVVIYQIGVGNRRGLGSSHYEIHRFMRLIEQDVLNALDDSEQAKSAAVLSNYCLSLGFGLNTPHCMGSVSYLGLNPIALTKKLIEKLAGNGNDANLQLTTAGLSWLIVSLGALSNYRNEELDLLVQTIVWLFEKSARILDSCSGDGFSGPALVATRAITVGFEFQRQVLQTIDEGLAACVRTAKVQALCSLIRAFAEDWEPSNAVVNSYSKPIWVDYCDFGRLVGVLIENQCERDVLEVAVKKNIGAISRGLFCQWKQYLAFLLLEGLAQRGKPLQDANADTDLSESTAKNLKKWVVGLSEEEAAEVEEDVYIVAEWVPGQIMHEVETWILHDFEDIPESVVVGRLLAWLSFLQFADIAAPVDFRNRPAFVSYLSKCNAVSEILNLGILYDGINDRNHEREPAAILGEKGRQREEALLELKQLATVSLFRSIEVLPSLSRRWWEEECPKVYISDVQSFVEKLVAPEILKRELDRIKTSESFGPMRVTASAVSREISATYVQDDFSLKVLISLPAAFPFRSAEVDCSQTLGVPQNRWKRWSLQITQMLNNQGGTLQDALSLWKNNVDKEFEGVEPCPVCYSVLHVKTHKLPALECKTCHNRFHVDCLTQWFRSSGKNQCVLCQQPWQGTRIQ